MKRYKKLTVSISTVAANIQIRNNELQPSL